MEKKYKNPSSGSYCSNRTGEIYASVYPDEQEVILDISRNEATCHQIFMKRKEWEKFRDEIDDQLGSKK